MGPSANRQQDTSQSPQYPSPVEYQEYKKREEERFMKHERNEFQIEQRDNSKFRSNHLTKSKTLKKRK